MSRSIVIVAIIAVAFGVARFIVPVEGAINHADVYKDLAHLFVGGLFGAAIMATKEKAVAAKTLWVLAVGLTILEIVAFIARKA